MRLPESCMIVGLLTNGFSVWQKKPAWTCSPHPGVLASTAERESSSLERARALCFSTRWCPDWCWGEWCLCQRWEQSSRYRWLLMPMLSLSWTCLWYVIDVRVYLAQEKGIAVATWRWVVPSYYSCVLKTSFRLEDCQPQWHCRNVISCLPTLHMPLRSRKGDKYLQANRILCLAVQQSVDFP